MTEIILLALDRHRRAVGRFVVRPLARPGAHRTPAVLEALDAYTVFMERSGQMTRFVEWLPAVVVASGAHVRACREALEGETP